MKNSANPTEVTTKKITTAEEFNGLFGTAAVMGSNGSPTPVDFTKEFVLAVYAPSTSKQTTIKPVRLQKSGDQLHYYYTVKEGKELTFQTKPSSLIIVDKKYDGDVDFIKE